MRRLLVLSVAGISLLAVQPGHATIRPQYGMSGVVLGMTKAKVRARLGSGAPGTRATDFLLGHGRVIQVTISRLR